MVVTSHRQEINTVYHREESQGLQDRKKQISIQAEMASLKNYQMVAESDKASKLSLGPHLELCYREQATNQRSMSTSLRRNRLPFLKVARPRL